MIFIEVYGERYLTSAMSGLQGNESELHFPFNSSPRATEPATRTHPLPDAELCDALLGHQLQNFHKKVPGRVDVQNVYFREVLLLCGHIYLCVCVYFLCLQSLLFAYGFVPVQEKVNLGTQNSRGWKGPLWVI